VLVATFAVAGLGPSIGPASTVGPTAALGSAPSRSSATPATGPAALPRLGVDDAVAIRDGGVDDREIRVAGFFAGIPTMFCPFQALPLNPTLINCAPATITVNRVSLPVAGSTAAVPGATFRASFALVGVPGRDVPTLPPSDVSTPTPSDAVMLVTLVGHFDDRRAALCPPESQARCGDPFIVDRVDAVDGALTGPTTFDGTAKDRGIPPPRLTAAEVDGKIATIDPSLTVLSRRIQTEAMLASIEPAWPAPVSPFGSAQSGAEARVLWLVTTVTPPDAGGRASARTFVIDDQTNQVREITKAAITTL
jgi:hypothetical protein